MSEYVPTVISECLRIVVCTRNWNWDNEEYQKGVIEPYNKIQKMQEQLEKEGKDAAVEQMMEALEMLRTVFKTKRVPLEEQLERFNEVFDKTNTRDSFPDFKMPTKEDITWE
jgi:[acyl-carrier-protein] S-malonyltransferase